MNKSQLKPLVILALCAGAAAILTFSLAAKADTGYRLLTPPRPCQCFPHPDTKQYPEMSKEEKKKYRDGIWWKYKKLSCEYTCIDANGSRTQVRGNQIRWAFMSEKGNEFKCEGVEMSTQDTPFGNSWNMYVIDGVNPFTPRYIESEIKELTTWAQQSNCY